MRILVTGGAGFIGSALIRHLMRHTRHQVLNVDKLTYAGNLESLSEVNDDPRYAFLQADIGDAAAMSAALADFAPDAVMHLAAESHVDRSIDGPAAFIQTNIVGSYVLLDACRAYWQALAGPRKPRRSASTIFPPTRCTATCRGRATCSAKPRPTRPARPTRRARPPPTTWCAPGSAPTGCRC